MHVTTPTTDRTPLSTATAIAADNPEVVAAKAQRVPVVPRAEMRATLSRLVHILMKKPPSRTRPLAAPSGNGNGKAVAAE